MSNCKEDKKHQAPAKAQENKNVWKQPSPAKTRGGKQGAWREAAGPSGKGIGFKGAGRGGKSGLQSWKKTIVSNGPNGASKVNTQKPNNLDSAEGLKAILGVKNKGSKQQATDASVGLKNMLGISSSLPNVEPEAEQKQGVDVGPVSAADALMQLMVQAPNNTSHSAPLPQQSSFNFTYVKEGDAKPPSPTVQLVAQHPMMYPQVSGGVYHPPVPHQMQYPTMMAQPIMIAQQPTMNVEAVSHSPIPINRVKKENNGVGKTSLIPSVTVKAKK